MKPSILETIKPQYIIDEKGKKTAVILNVKTFESILEELEDLYDVAQAEEIIKKGETEEGRTIEEIEESLNKKNN